MRTRFFFGVVTVAWVLLSGSPARAGESAADAAAGAALFAEGKALMDTGKYAEACAKFDAARALVTSTGAVLSLGDCYEKNGQTASAYGAFKEAGILARRLGEKDREAEAKRRADLAEPRLSKLVIEVSPGNRGTVSVQQNGRPVPPAALGSAVPVDPGEHTVDASSPGKQTWKRVVRIEAAPGTVTVTVPVLADAPVLAAEAAKAAAAPESWWGGQRIAGAAIGGAGVAGLVVGAVLGGMALGKNADSKAECKGTSPDVCSPAGAQARKDAFGLAHGATASLAIGGAALVGGGILLLTGSPAKGAPATGKVEAVPFAGAGVAGVSLRGVW
jgi:hypothetical protein